MGQTSAKRRKDAKGGEGRMGKTGTDCLVEEEEPAGLEAAGH